IFKFLFIALLIIGIIPYILSCKYAFEASQWHWIIFYTIIYLWTFGVTFLEKLAFQIRVWAGILGFYFLGVFSMLSMGLISSTRLYFLCFSAFATIFSGIRGGLAALFINITTLVLFAWIYSNDLVSLAHIQGVTTPEEWVVLIGTFFFLCAAVTLCLSVLIKALEISGCEFKHLVKNTHDIIWTLDQKFNITFINSAVYPAFGFVQKELMGKPLTHFLPDKKTDLFKDQIKTGTDFSYETIIHHKDGTPIHVEVMGSKISHFSGSHNMYQGIIRDISQKKIREKEQQQLNEKLIQAEKLKALGILAGSVAHDLNNILSGIATYPEVLMMDKNLDPQIRQGLTIIKDSGQKASAVVSDLLTISRGSGAEMEIININSIIDRYTRAHDFDKIRKTYDQVSINVSTEPELLNIKGSYIHIEKTIMNLVLNAVEEVSDKDDGKVLITTNNSYIDPSIPGYENRVQGEYVILSVIDNGSGIEQKNLKKIFDPFFTKKEMGKSGTGLGLTVVWNAVQDHNGFINVVSNKKGTRFDLLFPATREEIPQKKEGSSFDEIKGQGQMILIVDDLKDQQKIAATILENLGYHTKAVDNGYDAVDFIKKSPADLVILDMIMAPSISGLETYQRIKKINPGQKAIIASGYSESEEVLMAQDLGAGSFVKKPYTILDMGIAVKEELEK
ncbi:MAG: response regulator, partial [Proteobacteria bacterium]|nr:response regulator [Pseudomonadota bacterium]